MNLADLIGLMDREVTPQRTKLHLATWNGSEDPLDVYLAGRFEEWQAWQSKKNFERSYVLSLIKLRGVDRWLYAGVHTSKGSVWVEPKRAHKYELKELTSCGEFKGRLIAKLRRPGRQPYLDWDKLGSPLVVAEILPEPMNIGEFPGYKAVDLSRIDLDTIVRRGLESWRVALSNVAGVYLISDSHSQRLYVGSATGEGGIWHRWSQYAASGHGDNVELKALMARGNTADGFRFSILEIADVHASREDILQRECHWKRILMTRTCGLNAN